MQSNWSNQPRGMSTPTLWSDLQLWSDGSIDINMKELIKASNLSKERGDNLASRFKSEIGQGWSPFRYIIRSSITTSGIRWINHCYDITSIVQWYTFARCGDNALPIRRGHCLHSSPRHEPLKLCGTQWQQRVENVEPAAIEVVIVLLANISSKWRGTPFEGGVSLSLQTVAFSWERKHRSLLIQDSRKGMRMKLSLQGNMTLLASQFFH